MDPSAGVVAIRSPCAADVEEPLVDETVAVDVERADRLQVAVLVVTVEVRNLGVARVAVWVRVVAIEAAESGGLRAVAVAVFAALLHAALDFRRKLNLRHCGWPDRLPGAY